MLALILICSSAALADCDKANAERRLYYETVSKTPVGCLKEVAEYVAHSSLVDRLDHLKFYCDVRKI